MKFTSYILLFLITLSAFTFTSCEVIGDIFKTGMWFGIILVVLVVALIIWLIRKIF